MKTYQVIYADPPWRYQYRCGSGVAENHYPTMTVNEIKALPVKELADKNCVLFLWITFPMLQEAWGVMDAWGFRFKTVAFVWVKVNRKEDSLFTGLGWWTRANAEICLLATKGHPRRQQRVPRGWPTFSATGRGPLSKKIWTGGKGSCLRFYQVLEMFACEPSWA